MAATNPSQLLLLADHIKLSLLERQRAVALNLEPAAGDAQIARSLDSLAAGIAALEAQGPTWDDPLHPSVDTNAGILARIKDQFADLSAKFHGTAPTTAAITAPNDPALSADFARAQAVPRGRAGARQVSKSVRFTDSPPTSPQPVGRYARYTDEPEGASGADHAELSNEQIHAYHSAVMAEQDEALDRLGVSIGRQRELSIQIGDELDSQALLLDEVDERVDRHQGQLDRAGRRLRKFAEKARQNWGGLTIGILVCVLVLLIIITKR
ncbi:hypothetical protein EJ06DRAFT_529594 [Trichodelitschia bisporula]|uniref:t-SNARE coiled-coil homology domain-containing protein n=1 Tax=Trichodelitschia bisporula TaxID=703511 RepID=A0A6G1HZN5_9PEZI|nr:hypothetical protein EJ06DRAFT_529594 [Trichodelitschia bisporula]